MKNIGYILITLMLSFTACCGREGEMVAGTREADTLSMGDSLMSKSVSYYPDGTKEDEISIDGEGRLHGEYLSWFTNGLKATEWSFYHGKKHGKQLSWWQNGQLSNEKYFVYGELHGKSTLWSASGDIISVDYYEKGQLIPGKSIKSLYEPDSFLLKHLTDLGIDTLIAVQILRENLSFRTLETDSGVQVIFDEEVEAKIRSLIMLDDSGEIKPLLEE